MLLAPFRWALKILIVLVAAVAIYFAVTLVQVWLTSRHYDPHPAGAIVVMGAAQDNGVPTKVLAARLNEALILYRAGFAKEIMVTGNKEPGDVYTEAQASSMYLEAHGVPQSAILEAGGDNSYQNLADAAPQLLARQDGIVLVTTDPFHEDRSMAIASSLGLTPSPTPTQTSPITGVATIPYFLKEAIGVGFGRIIGWDHLEWLHAA
jgi:uncharacterized SAM-binding protein YcdF (DUF218 family)